MAVEVEAGDDRDVGSHLGTDRGQDLAIRIRCIVQHHGAVQREQHAVHALGVGEPPQQVAEKLFEGRPGHRSGGHAVGGEQGHDLRLGLGQHVQEGAHFGMAAAQDLQDFLAVEEGVASEEGQVGALQDEGVRFLLELADGDAHADAVYQGRPCRSIGPGSTAPG